jgi:RND family efflux transporter MFP subunit
VLRDQQISAQGAVTTAQSTFDIAQREVSRATTLENAGAIAQRDLEQARNALVAARGQLSTARAQLANVNKQLDKASVQAPFAGVVSVRSVNAGDVVTPGTALYTVVDPGSMQLEASVPAEALTAVRVGMPVDFTVNGYPNRHFSGRITRVNPTADPTTRQVKILASIPNAGNTLVGGLYAEGRVSSESHTAPMIPISSVDERGLRPTVVRLRNGKVEKVEVGLGIRDQAAETVEIISGLAPGDTVLLGAARGISPGTPVRVSSPSDVRK